MALFAHSVGLAQDVAPVTDVAQQPSPAQTAEPAAEPQVKIPTEPVEDFLAEKGLHHKWVHNVTELEDGTTITNGGYVHLEMGLHYKDEKGELREAKERIVLTPDGAEASETQIKVKFAPDILTAGAIDIRTPDGARLRGAPLGLSYYDAKSGRSVLLAEARSTIGELQPPNRLVYKDFLDDVIADAVYEITKAGVMQLILIKEKLPPPSEFGLPTDTTRLEVLTEFLDAPQPEKTVTVIKGETDEAKRAEMVEPDLKDTALRFGNAIMPRGTAFGINLDKNDPSKREPVAKTWQHFPEEGRSILFESVVYAPISESFKTLPENQQREQAFHVPTMSRQIPAKRIAARSSSSIHVALNESARTGFALDFTVQGLPLGSSTFSGNTTYFLSGYFSIEHAVFEAGTVVKYADLPSSLALSGDPVFLGTISLPTVFTSMHDDFYGEVVSASNGKPGVTSPRFQGPALMIKSTSGETINFKNLKMRFALKAIAFTDSAAGARTVQDSRFESCTTAVSVEDAGVTVTVSNVEICHVNTVTVGVASPGYSTVCTGDYYAIPKESLTPMSSSGSYSNAFDGNLTNYWISSTFGAPGYAVGQWIGADMGSARSIAAIQYYPYFGAGTYEGFNLFVMNSNPSTTPRANWGAPACPSGIWNWGTPAVAETKEVILSSPVSGRYVVLEFLQPSTSTTASAGEMWIYEAAPPSGNTPPTITGPIGLQTISEDTSTGVLNFTVADAETAVGSLTVTPFSSSDTTIIPLANVQVAGNAAARTVQVTPVADKSGGPVTITLRVSDGALTADLSFLVTVNAVNDAPMLNTISNPTAINEDAGLQTVSLAGIGTGAANETQALTVTATSGNTGLIPNPTVVYTSPNATGSLNYTPVPDASGTALITVTVKDTGLDGVAGNADDGSVVRTFTVTVNAVNDAPMLNTISNPTAINEDAGLQTVSLAGIGTGAANETQALTVTATSGNTGLIPNPTVVYTSPNATGSLNYTPVPDASGTALITVTVKDKGLDGVAGNADDGSVVRTFTVTVNAINDAPTITGPIAPQVIQENASTGPLNFAIGDIDTPLANLTVTAFSSSDPTIIPLANVALGGSGGARTVQVTAAANKNGGPVIITLRVSDGASTADLSFQVTVNAKPTISAISDQTIVHGGTIGPINFTVADAETAVGSLVVSKSVTGDTTLVPAANVVLGGTTENRTATITTAANRFGTAQVTLTVDDGNGGTASTSFNVYVLERMPKIISE